MNYIGSKVRLLEFLKESIHSVVGDDLSEMVFCDLFAGTGAVGRGFKNEVKTVIANDMEYYSYVLNRNYIGNNFEIDEHILELFEYLNNLELVDDGFIYNNYCLGSGSERMYFSDYNGKKIDTIRKKIESMRQDSVINEDQYYLLLASLLESSDKVANTASVYGAFLKKIKSSAEKNLVLIPATFEVTKSNSFIYNEDSTDVIKRISGDFLYLDPPYNQRQYSANYHILNTIALADDFVPKGVTGLREYNKSSYSKKKEVLGSFDELIKNSNFKYIFLSYNDEGLMSEDDIKMVMSNYGKHSLIKKEYKRFRADKASARNHKADKTFEHLHVLIKK